MYYCVINIFIYIYIYIFLYFRSSSGFNFFHRFKNYIPKIIIISFSLLFLNKILNFLDPIQNAHIDPAVHSLDRKCIDSIQNTINIDPVNSLVEYSSNRETAGNLNLVFITVNFY